MSDFLERARTAAERRWETYSDAAGGADVFDKPSLVVGFLGGARWARDVLLADPTDAEVEALGWIVAREALGREPGELFVYQIDAMRAAARAAIAAFLAERRGLRVRVRTKLCPVAPGATRGSDQ